MGTPNGVKVTIFLEEIQEIGGASLASKGEYDAWLLDFLNGEQFGSGFVSINPNSKIPALVDHQPKQRASSSSSSSSSDVTSAEPIRNSNQVLSYYTLQKSLIAS